MPPCVHIVVLNWNKPRETLDCLASLLRQDYRNYRVTLIDNGSRDDPAAAFAAYAGQVTLIGSPGNLGYAGGNNFGIARALTEGADYVWLVNNDAEVAPDCLAKLVAAAEADAAVGLASPVIRLQDDTGRIWVCGGRFSTETCLFEWFDDLARARAAMAESPATFMLPGTALLLRRSLLQRVGPLDDAFFAYDEDVDLAIRSARAGFRSVLVEAAEVRHRKDPGAHNPPHVCYYMFRNDFFVWRRHARPRAALRKALWQLNTLLDELEHCHGLPAQQQAMLSGYWHGLRGVTGAWRPEHRMPWPLRRLIISCPALIRGVLRLA